MNYLYLNCFFLAEEKFKSGRKLTKKCKTTSQTDRNMIKRDAAEFTYESSPSEEDSETEEDRAFINDSDESEDFDYSPVVAKLMGSRQRDRKRQL